MADKSIVGTLTVETDLAAVVASLREAGFAVFEPGERFVAVDALLGSVGESAAAVVLADAYNDGAPEAVAYEALKAAVDALTGQERSLPDAAREGHAQGCPDPCCRPGDAAP